MSETSRDPKYLLSVIGRQNGAIKKLLAERDELWALLEANGQKLDALTCLQRTYNNPDSSETNRIKAAAAAIGFELPKKATTNLVMVDFRERVRQARLRAPLVEPKIIEHALWRSGGLTPSAFLKSSSASPAWSVPGSPTT
jgi:hypothetical protein